MRRGIVVRRSAASSTRCNAGLPPEAWPLTLLNFAPHAPEQNPVEEVWRQGKNDLRQQRLEASQFSEVIAAFEARLER